MRSKISKPNAKSKERVPGPGSYEVPKGIQKFGSYFISKFLSSGVNYLLIISNNNLFIFFYKLL